MTGIPKGLMVAAGIGAVGIGGYMLFKGGDKPRDGADPASKDVAKPGEGAGAPGGAPGEAGALPTAGTPGAGGLPGAAAPGAGALPGAGAPGGAGQGGGDALPPGAQQVGPYTVIPDPQSGTKIVFETATRQPVGVLDAQGNLQPVSVGADGKVSVGQPDPSTASVTSAPTSGPGGFAPTGPGTPMGPASPAGLTAPGTGQAQAGATQYAQVAEALFAKAGDGTVGSAASDAMSGAGGIVPAPTATMATPTGGASPVAPQPVTTAAAATPAAGTGGLPPGSQQVGPYTVVPDPQSGANIVFDTATRQPLGVLDQQGKIVPIEALTRGGVGAATAGPATSGIGGAAPGAPTSAVPTGVGAGAPAGIGGAPAGIGLQ